MDRLVNALEKAADKIEGGLKYTTSFEGFEKDKDSGIDYVYYNVHALNTGDVPIPFTFNQFRDSGIVDKASQYFMAVDRLTVPTMLTPVMAWPMVDRNTVDNEYFSITLYYDDGKGDTKAYREYLEFPIPGVTSATNPIREPGMVMSFQGIMNSFNDAFNAATTALNADHAAELTQAPYMTFDPIANRIALNVLDELVEGKTIPNVTVFINSKAYVTFINAFITTFHGYNQPDGMDFKVNLSYNGINNATLPAFDDYKGVAYAGGAGLINYCEYPQTELFNNKRMVILNTSSVPVTNDLNSGDTSQSSSSNAMDQTLTDFVIVYSNALSGQSKTYIQYVPSLLRYKTLLNNTPLLNFDMTCFIEFTDHRRIQLLIPPGQCMTLKMRFQSKRTVITS
jgi:hypothetical protein